MENELIARDERGEQDAWPYDEADQEGSLSMEAYLAIESALCNPASQRPAINKSAKFPPDGEYCLSALTIQEGASKRDATCWYYRVMFRILGTAWDDYTFYTYFNLGHTSERARKISLRQWDAFMTATESTEMGDAIQKPFIGMIERSENSPGWACVTYDVSHFRPCSDLPAGVRL
jgi:hypothetical protein